MSSYFAFTTNSETYLVSPGAAGNSPRVPAEADDSNSCQLLTAAAVAPNEFLKKSRRITWMLPLEMNCQPLHASARIERWIQASPFAVAASAGMIRSA
jgi:hypothetical protein